MKTLLYWFLRLISGKPHEYIGGTANPYMLRWYIVPQNRWVKVFLHKFLRDDDERAMHDHPWNFWTIMLKGKYVEHTPSGIQIRRAPSIAYRPASAVHRVALFLDDETGHCIPAWTFVITGPKKRLWGFHCPTGFRSWQEFDQKGCDQ